MIKWTGWMLLPLAILTFALAKTSSDAQLRAARKTHQQKVNELRVEAALHREKLETIKENGSAERRELALQTDRIQERIDRVAADCRDVQETLNRLEEEQQATNATTGTGYDHDRSAQSFLAEARQLSVRIKRLQRAIASVTPEADQ